MPPRTPTATAHSTQNRGRSPRPTSWPAYGGCRQGRISGRGVLIHERPGTTPEVLPPYFFEGGGGGGARVLGIALAISPPSSGRPCGPCLRAARALPAAPTTASEGAQGPTEAIHAPWGRVRRRTAVTAEFGRFEGGIWPKISPRGSMRPQQRPQTCP